MMSKLCYPYGSGITCVCDMKGRIYKCFPEIDADGQVHDNGQMGEVADTLLDRNGGGNEDLLDGRYQQLWPLIIKSLGSFP